MSYGRMAFDSLSRRCEQGDASACEPFFVPRVPVFSDKAHSDELVKLGLELFRRSAGHGLAFFVATGVVKDHPTDLSAFIVEHKVDPVQLGEFMGEDFSLAQTLRLAYVHTMNLHGTGIVGALRKVFRFMRAPSELVKIDRITGAIAHLWWRTHEDDDFDSGLWEGMMEDGIDLDSTSFSEDSAAGPALEVSGAELRRCVRSLEGLWRLMFSTVMLCWNVHGKHADASGRETASPGRLSLNAWLEMNNSIEANGGTPSQMVQKIIYKLVTSGWCRELLPEEPSSKQPKLGATDSGFESGFEKLLAAQQASAIGEFGAGSPGQGLDIFGKASDKSTFLGWAAIPFGGLERHDASLPLVLAGVAGKGGAHPKLADCVISETSSSFFPQPLGVTSVWSRALAAEQNGEAVWLTLRFNQWLFLSSSPTDPAPFAFIWLKEAAVREVNPLGRHLILAGRRKSGDATTRTIDGSISGMSPFGDSERLPLPLCFLLADGRFQAFDALWLELQFNTDKELETWVDQLSSASAPREKKSLQ
ncbi:unnamed protein product, partial [Polarella glacialis]